MSRPPGQLPALQRAKGKDGARIGSFFLWTVDPTTKKYKRINLATKDETKARARRLEAMNGRRDFVYTDDEPAPAPAPPPPPIPVIPMSHQLAAMEGEPRPIVLPPEPAPLAQGPAAPAPSIGVETPSDANDWTKDAARAAGATDPSPSEPITAEPITDGDKSAPAPSAATAAVDDGKVRVKDIALMKTVFVSASRIAVQLQVAFHVLIARYLFKLELDPIRDEMPKDVAGFMAAQSAPWPETDPREPGRQMWEQFGRRVCPDDLVVPDWVLAPALVALGTLPIQVGNAKPVVKVKPHVPVVPMTPSTPAATPTTPAPNPEPAATAPPRSAHVPVMPDVS